MTLVGEEAESAAGRVSDIGLVSADSHVNEPRDLWSENLPPSLRDQAMEGIESGEDGSWNIVFNGKHVFKREMKDEQKRLEVLDPEKRFDVLRSQGIVGEAIFPTIGLYVWLLENVDGERESCRVYNEWLADTLQKKSGRFNCAGLIPAREPEKAAAEVERVAELGLRSIMLPSHSEVSWNRSVWRPMWDAIAATGLPVVMHQGTGFDTIWYRGPGATVANLVSSETIAPRVATLLATSGILARYPDMHVVFVEFNTGWIAWVEELMDFYDKVFREYDDIHRDERPKPTVYPDLEHPPSWYVKRQCHATFQIDYEGMRNVPQSGSASLMWGHDYPHEEGTYPNSQEIVDDLASYVSREDAQRIFRENALEIFKFDRELLDQPF